MTNTLVALRALYIQNFHIIYLCLHTVSKLFTLYNRDGHKFNLTNQLVHVYMFKSFAVCLPQFYCNVQIK